MSLIPEGSYRFDEFELDPSRRLLVRDGERIPVSPKSFEVLLYLVQHSRTVVLKNELLKGVWPDSFVEESNLTQHIFWLRKALKDRAVLIATIPGRGYEFTAQVRNDVSLDSSPRLRQVASPDIRTEQVHLQVNRKTTRVSYKETQLERPDLPISVKERSWPWRWVAVASAVVLLLVVTWGFWYRQHRVVPGDHHEVVLADFTDATPDHDFDRALKTLLSIDLSQSPYLVVATEPEVHDTLKLMGRPPDTPMTLTTALEVCQRMNDQVVLSGQIAGLGQQYAISLSALDCLNGRALIQTEAIADSREAVVRTLGDVTAAVRRRLGESLPLSSAHPLRREQTVSLDALRSYSQAMDMQNQEREAIPLFRRAVELDPQFAWGNFALSRAYELQGEFALQEKYLRIAYSMLDRLTDYQKFDVVNEYDIMTGVDFEKQLINLRSWAALYPNQATPLIRIVDLLKSLGRFEDAIAPGRRAVELEPNQIGPYIALTSTLVEAGHPQEAKAVCEQAFRRNLDGIFLHVTLYGIAIHEHDLKGIAAEEAWASNKDDGVAFPVWRLMGEGKAREAVSHMLQSVDDLRRQGFAEHADRRFRLLLRRESMYEMNSLLQEQIKSVDVTKYPDDLIFALAEMERVKDAQMELRLINAEPRATAVKRASVWAPALQFKWPCTNRRRRLQTLSPAGSMEWPAPS